MMQPFLCNFFLIHNYFYAETFFGDSWMYFNRSQIYRSNSCIMSAHYLLTHVVVTFLDLKENEDQDFFPKY